MADITARGRIPILTGGSGLYLKALTHGLSEVPPADPVLRAELSALPLAELQSRLDASDPDARSCTDFQNARRLIRALEIQALTGRPASALRKQWRGKNASGFRGLLLTRDRDDLNTVIADNVRTMFDRGVIDEVRACSSAGPTARMAIGFRDIQAHLRGELSRKECADAVVLATRRYAKRQLTWFRNQFSFPAIDLTGLRTRHELRQTLPTALQLLGSA